MDIFAFKTRKIGSNGAEPVSSVYRKFRPLAAVAFVSGDFPVNQAICAKQANKLRFRKCSFSVLYSIFCYICRGLCLGLVSMHLAQIYELTSPVSFSEQKWTDQLSIGVAFLVSVAFGMITHPLNLNRTRRLVQVLQTVDLYDDKYPPEKTTRFLTGKIKACILASILTTFLPALLVMREFKIINSLDYLRALERLGDSTESMSIASIAFQLTYMSALLEISGLFYYASLFYPSQLLQDRLEAIFGTIERKSAKMTAFASPLPSENEKTDHQNTGGNEFRKTSPTEPVPQMSWKALSGQYLDFFDIFEVYERFSGQYFCVLFFILIVSLVCIVYVQAALNIPFVEDVAPLITAIIPLSFVRLLFLCNIGDDYEKVHGRIIRSIARMREGTFWPEEKQEFDDFARLVRTIPIQLCAGGFFTVNRKNATSILSVVITYIIVLAQFSMSSSGENAARANKTSNFSSEMANISSD